MARHEPERDFPVLARRQGPVGEAVVVAAVGAGAHGVAHHRRVVLQAGAVAVRVPRRAFGATGLPRAQGARLGRQGERQHTGPRPHDHSQDAARVRGTARPTLSHTTRPTAAAASRGPRRTCRSRGGGRQRPAGCRRTCVHHRSVRGKVGRGSLAHGSGRGGRYRSGCHRAGGAHQLALRPHDGESGLRNLLLERGGVHHQRARHHAAGEGGTGPPHAEAGALPCEAGERVSAVGGASSRRALRGRAALSHGDQL